MVNYVNAFLVSFTGPQVFIILLVSIILIVGVFFFRKNYTQQIRVAIYMDDECEVYNKDGLIQYVKGHKKKLVNPIFLAIDVSNLSILYNTQISGKQKIMMDITDCMLQGLSPIEMVGRCTSQIFIVVLDNKEKEDIKKYCLKVEEKLLGLKIPEYGSYNFLLRFGINDKVDLNNISESIQQTISIFDFSNNRDNNFYYYTDVVTSSLDKYSDINSHKDQALEEHRFQAYIQPKVSLRTGKVVGGEILCRWLNSQGEIQYNPAEFVPIFESNGFIKKLDYEMFEQTCQLSQNLIQRGYKDFTLSVNISKVNFESKNFFEDLMQIMSKYAIMPKNIEIEITETAIMLNPTYVNTCLMKLRNMGFRLAMDDFGQEYSSLGALSSSLFDTIKMDRLFFVNNFTIDKEKMIATNILKMLKALNVEVVCEGIENEKVLEEIAKVNPDVIIQGFVYSRPVPSGQIEVLLQTTYPHDFDFGEEAEEVEEEVEEEVVEKPEKSAAPRKKTAKTISDDEIDELELLKNELLNMKLELEEQKAKQEQDAKRARLRRLREELKSLRNEPTQDETDKEIEALKKEIEKRKNASKETIEAEEEIVVEEEPTDNESEEE